MQNQHNPPSILPHTLYWTLRRTNELHFQITDRCNLNCKYCYADTISPDRTTDNLLMSSDIIKDGVRLVFESSKEAEISIIFHGGEPMFQSPSFYEDVCSFIEYEAVERHKKITFGMQSNLTLLTEDMLDVLKHYKVALGTSLDGPELVHNQMRGRFMATIKGIKEAQSGGIFSGPICVISSHNWNRMREVISFFCDLGISSFLANVGASVGRGNNLVPLPSDQIFQVFKDSFDVMFERGFDVIDKKIMQKVERHIFKRHGRYKFELKCDAPFCHAGITMIAVDRKGDIYPCGCAGTGSGIKKYCLGNIYAPDSHFDILLLQSFHAKSDKYSLTCKHCDAKYVCEYGCPAFDVQDPASAEAICEANRLFANYLDSHPEVCNQYRHYLAEAGVI